MIRKVRSSPCPCLLRLREILGVGVEAESVETWGVPGLRDALIVEDVA